MKKILLLSALIPLLALTGCNRNQVTSQNSNGQSLSNVTSEAISTSEQPLSSLVSETISTSEQSLSSLLSETISTSEQTSIVSENTSVVSSSSTQEISSLTTFFPISQEEEYIVDYENELFISEFYNINFKENVYEELGSNSNKALELYNPSSESIDLSKYTIKIYGNGSTEITIDDMIINLEGSLEPKTCYTLVNKYANDALKKHADVLTTVYIGPKSSVGLYKENHLIDVFGTIGASYTSNDDFVINGVEAAADIHNVIRIEGKRGSKTFIDTDWEVRQDSDKSTLGIHEDDTTNNKVTNPLEEEKKIFLELISTYYSGKDFYTNSKVEFIKEFKGYTFEYDVSWYEGTIDTEGNINVEKAGESYSFTFPISMKDKDGNEVLNSYSNEFSSEDYTYATIEYANFDYNSAE